MELDIYLLNIKYNVKIHEYKFIKLFQKIFSSIIIIF